LDWIDGDGNTRAQNLENGNEFVGETPYYPPPLARAPIDQAAWDAAFPNADQTVVGQIHPGPTTALIDAARRSSGAAALSNGHSRNEEAARAGPITSKEFEVPPTWVARDGITRAENLKRYGEDEDIEYWPPVKEAHMDVDAPIVREEL
jgi:hypothetical protein